MRPGDQVRIQDAAGDWHDAVAATGVEGTHATDPKTGRQHKIHDFPVLWVDTLGRDGRTHRLPWPTTHVVPGATARRYRHEITRRKP